MTRKGVKAVGKAGQTVSRSSRAYLHLLNRR